MDGNTNRKPHYSRRFCLFKGVTECIQVGPVSLSTENVGAGRSAEDDGTNHTRKAEGSSIMFLPQKFLWE